MRQGLTAAELEALIEVGRLMSAELDLEAVLKTVISAATELMHAEAAALVLIDDETDGLLFHTVQGDQANVVKRVRLKYGEGVVGSVIASGAPQIVSDVSRDKRFYSGVDQATGFATRSILCVPLKSDQRVWGAIEVLNKSDGVPFDSHDQRFCEAMASQAAAAIEIAMLHEEKVVAERLAAIGETVAGLAHCVKNVLNGIQGGSYIVDRGLKNNDKASIEHGWMMVKRHSEFMKRLTLDMLTYAKERVPEYETIDLNEIIEQVCEMCGDQAHSKGVTIAWEQDAAPRYVVVDPNGIRRCLLNLVSNAVDACPANNGGCVNVTTELVDDTTLRLHVADNGCGIAETDREKLFKTFYSTKGSRGTGLGLAVTHKIIAEHGGRIEVDSIEGEETTFTVVLPMKVGSSSNSAKLGRGVRSEGGSYS